MIDARSVLHKPKSNCRCDRPRNVLQVRHMSKTWTIRPSRRHEVIRSELGATPSEFCKRALDVFCNEHLEREERLRKLCGSLRAGRHASKKEGFGK